MISDERLKQAVHEAAEALDRSLPDPEGDCLYPVYLLRGDRFDVLIDGRK